MIQRDGILSFLKENKKFLFSECRLVKIGIFGSFSKNESNENSDIDLIIVSEKKSKIRNLVAKKFNRDVDLCREKYIKPYFRNQILQSAIYV